MKIAEISKQFAVHLGVEESVLADLRDDARLNGMMVFELDLSGLTNVADLCRYLESEFMYPYQTAGLDAAIDLISDLEWFENSQGYLVIVRSASDASPITGVFGSLLPPIVDMWRKQDIPFVIAVRERGDRLTVALAEANAEMEEAGSRPWAQPGTGPVDVVVHRTKTDT